MTRMSQLIIVWFRRDLRLEDNPALIAAIDSGASVLPVYIHAPQEEAPWAPGAASRWWLHHSLTALDQTLRDRGSYLHICKGATLQSLRELIAVTGAHAVYWNRGYEPACIGRDKRIKQALRDDGIDAKSFNGALLIEPWQIETGQGDPYRVFTPFWRKLRADLQIEAPQAAPAHIDTKQAEGSVALNSLHLRPKIPWDSEFGAHWLPGEFGAHESVQQFCEAALRDYKVERDRPDRVGTSRISPYLHFGEIGPRQIAWMLDRYARSESSLVLQEAGEPYLRELGWREFSHHLLYHFPHTPEKPLQAQFDAFPWAPDDAIALTRWQQGQTGIPIVDAGMRELWRTGWMHNRVRMLVASFLTKNLRQHWLHGARWFWDTLLDADLANNTQGWQWTAGSGADASPYFRIFNPVTQGYRFDPDGAYVKRWVPELADAPVKLVHEPWLDPALLQRTGYPPPMVDLAATRVAALDAYQRMRHA